MGRFAVAASARALFAIQMLMLAAGLAGLTATAVAWTFQPSVEFAPILALMALPRYLAFAFLPAAVLSVALMPPYAALAARESRDRRPHLQGLLLLLLVGLAISPLVGLGPVIEWWVFNLDQVREFDLLRPDPLGFNIVPLTFLVSLPSLPTVTILSFVLTSLLVGSGRPELAFRVLASCVAVQAGLVLGTHLFVNGLNDVGDALLQAMTSAGEGAEREANQVVDWIRRQQALADAATGILMWVLGGYAAALAVSKFLVPARAAATVNDAVRAVPSTPSLDVPAPPILVGVRTASAVAAVVFDKPSYAVRPRISLLRSAVRWRAAGYDIASIPPERSATYVFSWHDGVLRRQSDGVPLLVVTASSGLPLRRPYSVSDSATGAPLGRLEPDGSDWDVRDATGAPVVRVARTEARLGFIRWVANGATGEACRFTWTMGLGLSSAELELEFLPAAGPEFDRGLAVAIALLLEEQARRWTRRANV